MRTREVAFGLLVAGLVAGCGGDSGPSGPSGPPSISSINGATQPAGPAGSTVIVEGANFGDDQGTGALLFSDGAGGVAVGIIASSDDWTNDFIVATVPSGAATGSVVVQTSLGTSNAITFTLTQNAVFSPSTINWTATSSLPVGLSGHSAAFAEIHDAATTRAVYVAGGGDDTYVPSSAVYLATVGLTGALSAWSSTLALPAPVAFHASVVATPANSRVTGLGYLYVLGGATDQFGVPTANVYRGALSADGTISAWTQTTSLPVPTHSMGAVVFHGDLYVAGGDTTGNRPVATVYRSRIAETGELGAWQSQPSLPFPLAHFGFGTFGGYLYTFGGDNGFASPNGSEISNAAIADVAIARIDLRSGDLSSWFLNLTKLTKAVFKHTAVVAGGNVLVTAGIYNGATNGSTEESYAQILSDGTVGSFNGATGSNTISSQPGGGNLFNHAATGYTDGSGAFHVLVVGGDDFNSPGSKHAGAYFY
jgi:hypothetical protein